MSIARRLATLVLTLVPVLPAPVSAQPRRETEVTWRLLENNQDSGSLSSRFEVVVRDGAGRQTRLGPFAWPCGFAYADGEVSCVYGGAFDYLRVRRRGGLCAIEAQNSTEHGMRPTRVLGRVPCTGALSQWFEDAQHGRARQPVGRP